MKVRLCFVSNSSTSSYLIISTIVHHQSVLEKMGERAKIIKACSGLKKQKVLGQDCVVFTHISGEGGDLQWEFEKI